MIDPIDFCKFRLELDLAQKLAADAISAAVAQMKNEATRNEETLKEETSPVEGIFDAWITRELMFLQDAKGL